jgi:hypothetical protein
MDQNKEASRQRSKETLKERSRSRSGERHTVKFFSKEIFFNLFG